MLGVLERFETPDGAYEYVLRSSLELVVPLDRIPDVRAGLRNAVVTAGVFDDSIQPSHRRVLLRIVRPMRVDFNVPGDVRPLPELRFLVPKSVEEQADYISLEFSSGRLVVPTNMDLKSVMRRLAPASK